MSSFLSKEATWGILEGRCALQHYLGSRLSHPMGWDRVVIEEGLTKSKTAWEIKA